MNYYSIEIPHQREAHQRQTTAAAARPIYPIAQAIDPLALGQAVKTEQNSTPSYQQVIEMIERSMANMKVYVVESEITQTQNRIKAVIEQATF